MKLRVILRPVAEAEFDDAFDWYEALRKGMGRRYATAVRRVLSGIASQPRRHGILLSDVRKAIVKGFPYTIFYRHLPDHIDVLAVFHTSRDPSEWWTRV